MPKTGNSSHGRANRDLCETLRLGHEATVSLLVKAGAPNDILERSLNMHSVQGLATLLKIVDPKRGAVARRVALEREAIHGENRMDPVILKFLRLANAQNRERRCLALYYAMWIRDATLLERLVRSSPDYEQPAAILSVYAVKQDLASMLGILLRVVRPHVRQTALCYAAQAGRAGVFRAALQADQDEEAIEVAYGLASEFGHDEMLAMIRAYRAKQAARRTLESAATGAESK